MSNTPSASVDAMFLVARHGEDAHRRITKCVHSASAAGDEDRERYWRRVRRIVSRAR